MEGIERFGGGDLRGPRGCSEGQGKERKVGEEKKNINKEASHQVAYQESAFLFQVYQQLMLQ
jgi:hypothetical protein